MKYVHSRESRDGIENSVPETILKRPGCHRWAPEEFSPDDFRHGYIWQDCHNDARALLGSDQGVQDYINRETQPKAQAAAAAKAEAEEGATPDMFHKS